jgi:hypothetical protein
LFLLQNSTISDVVKALPVQVKCFHQVPVPIKIYVDSSGRRVGKRKHTDLSSLVSAVGNSDLNEDDEEQAITGDDLQGLQEEGTKKKNFMSLTQSLTEWFETVTSEDAKAKKKRKEDVPETKFASIEDIKGLNYELLLRGPNSSRNSKIKTLQLHDRYDKAYHSGPVKDRLPPTSFSHYLFYTRDARRQMLQVLQSDATLIEVTKQHGLQNIPPGLYVLADRGFAGCSSCYPNANSIIFPSFVLGREQFEVEEVKKNISICRLRYSSEVFFSRVTDSAMMRGVVEMNKLKHFYAHLAFSHARNNICYEPLSKPANWEDYIKETYNKSPTCEG